jgi:uncharacterized protein (DUF1800 family)
MLRHAAGLYFALMLSALLPTQSVLALNLTWEWLYDASGLVAGADADGDGWTNKAEEEAGTDPKDGASFPYLRHRALDAATLGLEWDSAAGKRYTLWKKDSLEDTDWEQVGQPFISEGGVLEMPTGAENGTGAFYRLTVLDTDTDGDQLTDWEELIMGYDPNRAHTERYPQTDLQRFQAGYGGNSLLSLSVYDRECWERWPDPAVFVIRRTGSLKPLAVNIIVGGDADRDEDYTLPFTGNVVHFAPGQREYFIKVTPIEDPDLEGTPEPTETVTLSLAEGTGYNIDTVLPTYSPADTDRPVTAGPLATITIVNQPEGSGPSPEEAARFLIQAGFGPNRDDPADADEIPENVEEVMALGFEGWINAQFNKPKGFLLPFVDWGIANPGQQLYVPLWSMAWWGRVLGAPRIRPDAPGPQEADPLRQRMAFALSQIFVVSYRPEIYANKPRVMPGYYDILINRAFGNYRTLLNEVTYCPVMGHYLSYLANPKADGNGRFPDENYAREVMQLFSIGLWELNQDGTRELDGNNQPIPTYDNEDISNFARVFTGLSYPTGFNAYSEDFLTPMVGWDNQHDLAPKNLLGVVTEPRTAGNAGQATDADVEVALDVLFNHQNVGPFIGKLLIQRFVTSNPSPEYVSRVAAKFNNNGLGERGDLFAVLKQILLDPEARNASKMTDPTFGKLREPLLKSVARGTAFNAAAQSEWYYMSGFYDVQAQEVLSSPSVFNFYLPTYSPPGILTKEGLSAPEFQLLNATTLAKTANYYYGDNAAVEPISAGGQANPVRQVNMNLSHEYALSSQSIADGNNSAVYDPDALIRRLDMALTGGTLEPETFQIIREAVVKMRLNSVWVWPRARVNLAIYLIMNSPEMNVAH